MTKTETEETVTMKDVDPLHGLNPGRIVYYWESVMNVGLVPNPSIVVAVFRDGEKKRTGGVRLRVFYADGSDSVKVSVMHNAKPQENRWTWPMNLDGSKFTD